MHEFKGGFIMPGKKKKRLVVSGYRYGRIIILAACFVWVVCACNLIMNRKDEKELSVNEAFCSVVYSDIQAEISGSGEIDIKGDMSAKRMVLMDMAKNLEINKYSITNEDGDCRLYQQSKNGEVTLEIINADGKDYIRANVMINKGFETVSVYKKVFEKCFKQFDVDSDITVTMSGSVNGRLSLDEMEHLSGKFLKNMSAKEVTTGRMEEAYTVYAYSKTVPEYLNVGKQKVNVNVTMNYEEELKRTIVRLSTPVYNGDY